MAKRERVYEIDQVALRELRVFIDNDGQLYRQMVEPIRANLAKKLEGGRYDPKKAPRGWQYLVDEGARRYVKEFGGDVRSLFPLPLRVALSHEYAQDWEDDNLPQRPSRPGKFEGSPAYVPYFWDIGMDGGADDEEWDGDTPIWVFHITPEDRAMFPELGKQRTVEV